jgi:hypothetical protein
MEYKDPLGHPDLLVRMVQPVLLVHQEKPRQEEVPCLPLVNKVRRVIQELLVQQDQLVILVPSEQLEKRGLMVQRGHQEQLDRLEGLGLPVFKVIKV